ncbi:MAG TPA: site-2 protease family protein [archaeon]|nr:site-2 protease family protein [archaeon]
MRLIEFRDIAVSAIVLAFVFSYEGFGNADRLIKNIPFALLAVSLGFVLHELAHRQIAKKYRCHAEYKLWKEGLILAFVFALVSNGNFVFAAPGAVMIYPIADLWGHSAELTRKKMGLISIAGPIMNIALAAVFFVAMFFSTGMLAEAFSLGARINIWLALFNLIPIGPLDGQKIFSWSRKLWAVFFAVVVTMFTLLIL